MKLGEIRSVLLGLGLCTLAWISWSSADVPSEEVSRKPSTYAPAKALEAQVAETLERIHDDLKEDDEYGSSQVKRVTKDAQTIAVVAMVMGHHDETNAWKGKAGLVMKAALELSDRADDGEAARKALAKLDQALESKGNAEPLAWQPVGDIDQLMHQVPVLNTRLRGAVRRLSRSQDKATRIAATLAAIAQVSMFDDTYCADDEDQAKWIAYCARMREAAHHCFQVAQQGDQDAAKEALKQLTRSCDDCHDTFREEDD